MIMIVIKLLNQKLYFHKLIVFLNLNYKLFLDIIIQ